MIGDITSLFQLRSFWVALTSVCPNKDGLVVQSNKNSKAAVFFAAFFCLYRVTEKTEKSSSFYAPKPTKLYNYFSQGEKRRPEMRLRFAG